MRVFVIAFACEPNRTSEPGVGWNIVGELAKIHELTVLTRRNNREVIEEFLGRNPAAPQVNIHWEYLDLPEWFHRLKKRLPCGIQLYQELWQWKAAQIYRNVFAQYDIVHHLTFGSIFFTPWAARWTSCFVWGPIGGASGAMEREFLRDESLKSKISEMFYRFVAWYSFHPVPWVAKCRKACRIILYRTSELANRARSEGLKVSGVLGESAYPHLIYARNYQTKKHPIKIICVGRLVPLKGVRYVIKGFAQFVERGGEGTLEIIGDGVLRSQLERLCLSLGVSSYVAFRGNIPNKDVLSELDSADVLVHASFREGISWTILEAMAHGAPVICQDRAGMKDVVTEECGFRILAKHPKQLENGIAHALLKLYENPLQIEALGRNGQDRITAVYSWSRISCEIDRVYKVCVTSNNL